MTIMTKPMGVNSIPRIYEYVPQPKPQPGFGFYRCCVGWPRQDVYAEGGLMDLISDRLQISRLTFLKHVNRKELRELEKNLGYNDHPKRGMTMAADWHVEYFRSKHHGETVYGFRHSAIEYVFKRRG